MSTEKEHPQIFVEWVLAFLEERFPWLASEADESVSGAETVDEPCEPDEWLVEKCQKVRREDVNQTCRSIAAEE